MGGISGIFNFTSVKKRSKSYTPCKHLEIEIPFIPPIYGLQFLSVSIYCASKCAKQVSKKTTDSPPENNQVLSPTSCVAPGRIFGMTFPTVPPARAQVPVRSLRGVDQDLGARGGRAIRKVVPKILPRATQDVHFPPGGSGLRGGGRKFAPRDIYIGWK